MSEGAPSPQPSGWRGEAGRLGVLAAVGTWLLHPFMTGRLVGTGDALWYANMLADFVSQWRAGVFPVFVGQTDYAFNGAVYPLRVAPLYQHLAGLIDLLTARTLSFYALQHATVLVCGFGGLLSAYLTARRLGPDRPWQAVAAAVLYLSCPGVLGTIYTQDLYMTWMTVPFLPLAVYGILRTYERDDVRSQVWLAAPLAALWYAHSPVALWMTLIAASSQVVRLAGPHRTIAAIKRAALGAGLFLLLGHYPFVSVASLQVPGATSAVTAGLTEQDRITNVIREVFPAVLRPVSEAARALSDLQLGYALWLLLGLLLIAALRAGPRPGLRVLAAACLGLLALLLPIPGLTDWLWAHLPEAIKRITFYWPMHRFYLLLAALLTVGAAALVPRARPSPLAPPTSPLIPHTSPLIPPTSHLAAALLAFLACAWSLWESRQFIRAGHERTASAEVTARSQRPENRLLMNHAYGLFPALPATFSNGVMAPWAETRLLDPVTGETPAPVAPASGPAWQPFRGEIDANPGIVNLRPVLRLEPGRRYELDLRFANADAPGVLQLVGRHFFREYVLPASGQPRSFGSRPPHSSTLPLWTSAAEPEEVTVRFIPTAPGARAADFLAFGQFRLHDLKPGASSVDVTTLLPFRVTVRAPAEGAQLETPRMYLPGYVAEVNGRAVEAKRSVDGLVTVAVPGGSSDVVLSYRAPWSVQLSYFVALAAWAGLFAVGAASSRRK